MFAAIKSSEKTPGNKKRQKRVFRSNVQNVSKVLNNWLTMSKVTDSKMNRPSIARRWSYHILYLYFCLYLCMLDVQVTVRWYGAVARAKLLRSLTRSCPRSIRSRTPPTRSADTRSSRDRTKEFRSSSPTSTSTIRKATRTTLTGSPVLVA